MLYLVEWCIFIREGVCEEEKRLAEELRRDEARSMLENAAWMQRERVAQEEFSKKRELEERRRSEREEREVREAKQRVYDGVMCMFY